MVACPGTCRNYYNIDTDRTISFERETYTVIEDEGPAEVCITSTDLTGIVEVVIRPLMKAVDAPAAGKTIIKGQ